MGIKYFLPSTWWRSHMHKLPWSKWKVIFTMKGEIAQLINAKKKLKAEYIWCIFSVFAYCARTLLLDAMRASDEQFVYFVFAFVFFLSSIFFLCFSNANVMLLIIVELRLFQLSDTERTYLCVMWCGAVCVP